MNDSILATAVAAGRGALSESEGKALLAQYGIHVPRSRVVADAEEAATAVAGVDGPFVVKVVSPDILHKSDSGGVAVGLADGAAVAGAIREMARRPAIAAAAVEGYLVEEMAPAGLEVVGRRVSRPAVRPDGDGGPRGNLRRSARRRELPAVPHRPDRGRRDARRTQGRGAARRRPRVGRSLARRHRRRPAEDRRRGRIDAARRRHRRDRREPDDRLSPAVRQRSTRA